MPETENGQAREEDLRRLLTDAIEVQLAALKAGIGFWTEWIEQTSEFVNSATKTLAQINAEDQQAKDLLLELVDAGRASLRSMTEIPRHTATRFIEELDKLEAENAAEETERAAKRSARRAARTTPSVPTRGAARTGPSAPTRTPTAKQGRKRPKRAGRVKS